MKLVEETSAGVTELTPGQVREELDKYVALVTEIFPQVSPSATHEERREHLRNLARSYNANVARIANLRAFIKQEL
jgi:hypothetical protein